MTVSSANRCQMWIKGSKAQLAPYMSTYIEYGHVYVQFCNKWKTLVQKKSNEKKGQPSLISPTCGHMCTIMSCLCTILRQMAYSSATKLK